MKLVLSSGFETDNVLILFFFENNSLASQKIFNYFAGVCFLFVFFVNFKTHYLVATIFMDAYFGSHSCV